SSSVAFGKAPDFWPEQAMWELGDFEAQAGNPCEARRLMQDLSRRASGEWQSRANGRLGELSCSPAQQQVSALRRLAYGRDVALICVFQAGARAEHWNRACADMTSLLTESGAARVSANELTPQAAAIAAESCARGCAKAPGGE